MVDNKYKSMTDDELRKFMVNDPDAYYEFYLRHRNTKLEDVPTTCGNRSEDLDYYGDPNGGNR